MHLIPEMVYRETIEGRGLGWLTDTLWIGEGRLAGKQQIEYRIYRVD